MQCYVSFTSASCASIKLNIKQFQSNTYHPESQGALERFHQILNNIMNTFCLDHKQKQISRALIIALALIFRSGMASGGCTHYS
jgi:hypothetical protein